MATQRTRMKSSDLRVPEYQHLKATCEARLKHINAHPLCNHPVGCLRVKLTQPTTDELGYDRVRPFFHSDFSLPF